VIEGFPKFEPDTVEMPPQELHELAMQLIKAATVEPGHGYHIPGVWAHLIRDNLDAAVQLTGFASRNYRSTMMAIASFALRAVVSYDAMHQRSVDCNTLLSSWEPELFVEGTFLVGGREEGMGAILLHQH
jgi:hypothetical protein